MKFTTVGEINEYRSESINPLLEPDTVFEVYSVPIYDTGHPEYLSGKEIGSTKQIVQKDDILLCKINPRINRVWIVSDESDQRNIASSEWIVIRNHSYNPQYLAWYFRSEVFKSLMISEVTGIGGSLTRAQPKRVATYPVPVLDRHEQDCIVDRLNRLHSVIQYRMMQLQKLDELVKARFVEMFGDLRNNPKGWPVYRFEEITDIITDGEHATPRRTDHGIYLLSARNVLDHALRLDDVDYIDQDEYERIAKRIIPQAGDVLISCSGSVGRCCTVPAGLKFQMVRSTALLRFKKMILPVYAEYMITSDDLQEQINSSKTASSQANLFQGKIAKLKGFVPPFTLQNEFAVFVSQVDKSKLSIQASLDQLETLKQSLMQEYFG